MSSKCGCIYCGECDDLSVSDIIPDALTNGKICNRNVCRIKHNNNFSDAFEYEVISGLAAITNVLNVKSSKGKSYAKYPLKIIVDGIGYDANISAETEIFQNGKIFKSEDGKHFLGPLDKLSQFKKAKIENVSEVDVNEGGVEKRITVDLSIFFSDSMYRLMTKIAFEWYCLCNDIQSKCDELEDVVQFICDGTGKNPVNIFCDGKEQIFNCLLSNKGNHTLILYVPEDGSLNVLINLFGIVFYNVKLCDKVPKNCIYKICYTTIGLDGEKIEFKSKNEEELWKEIKSQIIPVSNENQFQIMAPQNMDDKTIAPKMFCLTTDWLNQGLDFNMEESELRKNLKKNIDYVFAMSSFTLRGLKRFVKEHERIIDEGMKINKKAVVTKELFLFYSLYIAGLQYEEIDSFEKLNQKIVEKFGNKEIELSYDICKKLQEEMLDNNEYAEVIKCGAKIVSKM